MNNNRIIDDKNLEMMCAIDCISSVLSDDVICNVLEKMRNKRKKRVMFCKECKMYDGLGEYKEKYLEVIIKYFNKEIVETKDVLNLKDMDLEKMYFICRELQSLIHRLQKDKSSMVLPKGGSHLKLLEGHSVAIVSLYRIVYNAITKMLYN